MPDHSTKVTATRPLVPARMASSTRGSAKAVAYPERCSSNFDSSMLPETSAASTRRRSTRPAAWVEVQPVAAISAATTNIRRERIMLAPPETGNFEGDRKPAITKTTVSKSSTSQFSRLETIGKQLRVTHRVLDVLLLQGVGHLVCLYVS